MKKIILSAVVLLAFAQVASAASIQIDTADAGANKVYTLTLLADVSEEFNGFGYSATPNAPGVFVEVIPGAFGDTSAKPNTFVSPILAFPAPIGDGLTLPAPAVNTENGQSFDAGKLGSFIDASAGIWLGNVVMPASGMGTYRVVLQNTGQNIAELTGPIGIPEPSTMVLAGLSMIGLVLRRRNG
ncbi:PEP-CTERM sorting domain-containing protein [Bythopirellula goksoeyrii]|uniref:Ice-binding protein C-terminal domain-containing protein n=1 Tax=Bythopirellula goksoeyrii TaxID=1400387 RepID=A0A5B9Q8U7_9BACT|nr:PEP-CTERM sorting domain-containing protein [Bythopirellula goksoeyrii]QEG33852.1 hypothetical protein Pr1d_11220 [Bythopirellula goksoeyrii]